jgi:hypothetical protein
MVMISRMSLPDWTANDDPEKEAKCRKHPIPSRDEIKERINRENPESDRPSDDPSWLTDKELQNAVEMADPFFYDEPEATAICRGTYDGKGCPFRNICLEIALVNNESVGTFGGLTTLQRKWVRKNIPRYEYKTDAKGKVLKDKDGNKIVKKNNWRWSNEWLDQVPSHESLDPNIGRDDEEEE